MFHIEFLIGQLDWERILFDILLRLLELVTRHQFDFPYRCISPTGVFPLQVYFHVVIKMKLFCLLFA